MSFPFQVSILSTTFIGVNMKKSPVQMPTGNFKQSFAIFYYLFMSSLWGLHFARYQKNFWRNMAPPRLIETGGALQSAVAVQKQATENNGKKCFTRNRNEKKKTTPSWKYLVSDTALVYKHVARPSTNYPISRRRASAHVAPRRLVTERSWVLKH